MTEFEAEFEQLDAQFASLESTLDGLEGVTSAFRRELEGVEGGLKDAGREATSMSRSVGMSFRRAFEGVVFDGKKVSDTLSGLGQSLSRTVLNRALAPVQNAIGKGLQSVVSGVLPFANGGVLTGGRVAAFARGGIVDRPTSFPLRGGIGLMGEAGPEAILPLARGADGSLGIRAGAGGSVVHVTMNISTPDVQSFEKSRSQIAADLSRAMQRGGRNL